MAATKGSFNARNQRKFVPAEMRNFMSIDSAQVSVGKGVMKDQVSTNRAANVSTMRTSEHQTIDDSTVYNIQNKSTMGNEESVIE